MPVAVTFTISRFSASLYVTKYLIASSLAFYLIVAAGMEVIKRRYMKVLTMAAILIVSFSGIFKYYTEVNKIPWRDVAEYISKNAKRGDLVVSNDVLCSKNVFDYYFRRPDVAEVIFQGGYVNSLVASLDEKRIREFEKLASGHKRVWLVLAHTLDRDMLVRDRILKSYKLLYHRIYPTRSYITHKTDNLIEIFLLEKI